MLLQASPHQPWRLPWGPAPSAGALCGHAHTLLEQWGSNKTQGTQRNVRHPCQLEAPTGPMRARLGVSFPSSHSCHPPGKCPRECLLMSQAAQGADIPCTRWRKRWSSQESQCQTVGTTSQCLPAAFSAPGREVLRPCLGRCDVTASHEAVFLLLATLDLCLPLQWIPARALLSRI